MARRRAQEAHKLKHFLLHFSSHCATYIILTLNRCLKRFYSNSIDRSALWWLSVTKRHLRFICFEKNITPWKYNTIVMHYYKFNFGWVKIVGPFLKRNNVLLCTSNWNPLAITWLCCESLVRFCKVRSICPYFQCRHWLFSTNILFSPQRDRILI